jgi:hypothetical protein
VVAGEDPVVGTAVGGLTLSDQEDGAAGLCQESGTGAPEHPPSYDRDVDVPGVHRLTEGRRSVAGCRGTDLGEHVPDEEHDGCRRC